MYEKLDSQLLDIASKYPDFNCSEEERHKVGKLLSDEIDKYFPHKIQDGPELNGLKQKGYTSLAPLLNNLEIEQVTNFLSDKSVYNAHVAPGDGNLRTVEQSRRCGASACYGLQDLLQCPFLLEKALSPSLLDLIEGYLECVPTLYSFNTFWTFTGYPYDGVKLFHRDMDDFKFCCVLVYLVDVDEHTGPHSYIKYTHKKDICIARNQNTEFCESIFPPTMREGHGNDSYFRSELQKDVDILTGIAGTSILADTFGLHKGEGNLQKDRLMFWIRYGAFNNPSCRNQTPNPKNFKLVKDKQIIFDDKLKYITRRLLNHDV